MAELPPPRRLDQSPRSEKPEQPATVGDVTERSRSSKRRRSASSRDSEESSSDGQEVRDRFTYDEMMARLRDTADAKKGARRSNQPVVKVRRVRRRLLIAGSVLLVLSVGAWQGYRFLNSLRISGETFRTEVNRRASELLGTQITFTKFTRGSEDISTAAGRLETREPVLLRSADLAGISAFLTPGTWWSHDWGVSLLSIREAKINLSATEPPAAADTQHWTVIDAGRERAPHGKFRIGIASDPDAISVDVVRFADLQINWPGAGGKAESLSSLAGSFTPGLAGNVFELRDGELQLAGLPVLPVAKLNGRITGDKLTITGARVGIGTNAELRLSGEADLRLDGGINLQGELPVVSARALLPSVWAERVSGRLELKELAWTSRFLSGPPSQFQGAFVLHGASLSHLTMLDRLAAIMGVDSKKLVPLEMATLSGRFVWTAAGCRITEISGEMDGRFRLSGELTVDGDAKLAGNLKLDLAGGAIVALGGVIPAQFKQLDDGWYSIDIALSGTSSLPVDSLAGIEPAPAREEAPRRTGTLAPPLKHTKPADNDLERAFRETMESRD